MSHSLQLGFSATDAMAAPALSLRLGTQRDSFWTLLLRRLVVPRPKSAADALQSVSAPSAARETSKEAGDTGDGWAIFQQVVAPQLDAAYNFARYLARDPDAAQDIVQDAFLKALRGFSGYRGGDARAWLLAIVRNCYHDWRLERRRRLSVEVSSDHGCGADDDDDASAGEMPSEEDSPEAALIRQSESQQVRAVLNGLAQPLREILILRELEDLSYRSIAEVTALPIGTVMSRLARARQAFGQAWRLRAGEEERS